MAYAHASRCVTGSGFRLIVPREWDPYVVVLAVGSPYYDYFCFFFIFMKFEMSVPPEVAARIVALIDEGRSRRSVAREYNLASSSVQHIYNRYLETGSYAHRSRSGRPRCTDVREDRHIVRRALRNPFLTSSMLAMEANASRAKPITSRTVQNRLREQGLRSRKPAEGPVLSRRHRRARLEFARNHVSWTAADWRRVLFTDESRFTLQGPDGRIRIWRRDGTRYQQPHFIRRSNFFGGSKMVWGGIQYDAKTELHVCRTPSVTAAVYIRDILLDYVVPFAPFIGDRFLLQQDNARPHVARATKAFLEEAGIATMEWPACSPDLNPIEHVWDKMGRRLRARTTPVNSLAELESALVEEWNNIPQEDIQALIDSMPRRCEAVIRALGGNTRY